MHVSKCMAAMVIGGLVLGQSLLAAGTDAAMPDREKDHEALRALKTTVVNAMNAQDTNALAACFASEFVFTASTQTVITNKAELDALYNRMFKAEKAPLKSMTTAPEAAIQTRFTDANTGYCYGSTKDTYVLKNGRTVVIPAQWTAVVVKQNGVWKVAAAHVGVDFLDNPVLHGQQLSVWSKIGMFFWGSSGN